MIICPKCNAKNEEGSAFCSQCGSKIEFSEEDEKPNVTNANAQNENTKIKNTKNNKPNGFYYFLAVLVLLLSFAAAFIIFSSGAEIADISSVGGRTLEEAYYHSVGKIYKGFSIVTSVFGIFFSSVLVKLAKR